MTYECAVVGANIIAIASSGKVREKRSRGYSWIGATTSVIHSVFTTATAGGSQETLIPRSLAKK